MKEALTRLGLSTSLSIRPSDEWDILRASHELAKCDGCAKPPKEVAGCCRPFAKVDGGNVVISYGYCQKGRAFLLQRKIDRLTKASGIGGRFAQRRFETFKPLAGTEDALRICRDFCVSFAPDAKGIRLCGSCGCGKTHLAAAILNELMGRGVAGMFLVVPDFMRQLRAAFDDKRLAPAVNELMETARIVPLLVLDDLGAEKASEWAKEQLYILVNARYERYLPTIVTTNYSDAQLGEQIGKRITSRLAEMTTSVTIKAGDHRRYVQTRLWGMNVSAPPL